MARIEVVRDRWPENLNGAKFWMDKDEEFYNEWLIGDPDEIRNKPEPTFTLSSEDVDQLVIKWLRGPEGPVGVMGPMGIPGPGAE